MHDDDHQPEEEDEDRMINNLADASLLNSFGKATSAHVAELLAVYSAHEPGNRKRRLYYLDKQEPKHLGIAIPQEFANLDVSIGWCAKAVDMLACRSVLNGFSCESGVNPEIDRMLRENRMSLKYDMAKTSELINGVGFWTVDRGGAGEPEVVINFHNAESAAAVWDYRRNRVKYGMVIADYMEKNGKTVPCEYHIYEENLITVAKLINGIWMAQAYPMQIGCCPMVAMTYRPTYERPFGRSRVSRTMRSLTDEMQREMIRTALHSELFSFPARYVLGADDSAFEKSKLQLYMDAFLLFSKDEYGDTPQVGQFAQASMEPHISYMEFLARKAASEAKLPMAAFGVQGNGYTSSDALRASFDDAIIECEALNKTNGEALVDIMLIALAASHRTDIHSLSEDELTLSVQWTNPAMPSMAAQTDAMVKQGAQIEWLPGTTVYLEQLGYSKDQIQRMRAEKNRETTSKALAAALIGTNDGNPA